MEEPTDKPKLIIRRIEKDKPALTVDELNALQKMIERRRQEREDAEKNNAR